jgi:dTDP-4-amino-4,6-dideoxygalactose transaminase
MSSAIPFTNLVLPHAQLVEELASVFRITLETGLFAGGPMVESFESAFAERCEVRHCVGVGSGTDAVRFALMAAGVNRGDTVLTVPNTFIATAEAISQAGASVDFVDVDERTYNMDAEKLCEYLETRCAVDTRSGKLANKQSGKPIAAVVPVHLYGQVADMDGLLELAQRFSLAVIEDACQAHGAEYFSAKQGCWKNAGSMGHAAAFSFYPAKNLGACGEAGAVTTNDEGLAQRVRMLRDHGQARKYYHEVEGYNGRLDAVQAGILRVKLRFLSEWNTKRRERASIYNELLAPAVPQLALPYEPQWSKAVYHLYVIRTPERDQLQKNLAKAQIGTGIHYPIPLHLQKAYRGLAYKEGDFPVSERAAREILSLPMYPELRVADQQGVAHEVLRSLAASTKSQSRAGVPISAA